jgi:hypothetical protein
MKGVSLRAAARHPVGLRLWLADVPDGARLEALPPLVSLLSAMADGVALLLADGPPETLPPLRLALTDAAGRLLTELRLPDPPRVDAAAALATAPPALGFALLSAPDASPLLTAPPLPLGWLTAWAAALPLAAGEALAEPSGATLAFLPGGGTLAAVLLPRPDGGLHPLALVPTRRLETGRGVLLHALPPEPPALLLLDTMDGLQRLAPRPLAQAVLAATLEGAARKLAPDAAAGFVTEAAPAVPAPPAPGAETSGPPVLLLAGAADEFARRLLFLAADELARCFAEILLFGPDMRAEATWLAARSAVPVRAAPPLAEAPRRTALARATLVPAGPAALAEALANGDAAALLARALPGTALPALVALAAAEGDDEAAVLRLAGEAA